MSQLLERPAADCCCNYPALGSITGWNNSLTNIVLGLMIDTQLNKSGPWKVYAYAGDPLTNLVKGWTKRFDARVSASPRLFLHYERRMGRCVGLTHSLKIHDVLSHPLGTFTRSLTKIGERKFGHERGHGEEAQLSSGWFSIGWGLPSLSFNAYVRAELLFASRYPNG